MIDRLRTQVTDILTAWTDSEGVRHPGLHLMLERHLRVGPVHMADDKPYAKSKIAAGPAPWDDAVAHLLADISSGVRTIERGLDLACGFSPRERGGSDGNTRHALSRLPDLVDALPADARELAVEPSVTVGMWHRGALLLLGAERRWAHIRVTDDDGNPLIATCPNCQDAVRIRPDLADLGDPHRATGHDCDVIGCTQRGPDAIRGDQHAEAECVNQECRDDNGYRRTWPIDPWLGRLVGWKYDTTHRDDAVA
jgi:hypothetical protein